jgi:hypothetical protein
MPKVTIEFDLPEEQGELDAALRGREALTVIWDIDQRLRGLLKHGEPTEAQKELANEIREMIPLELTEI